MDQFSGNLTGVYEKINRLKEDFLTHADKVKLENSEGDQLVAFMEQIEQAEGSIYENNTLSKIIENILLRERAKDGNNKRENILIIDDLDRLDPEHLFRILNVFAAQFDSHGKAASKFGFDKIILVCDINNVRNIFHSKYGLDVDFIGYIDKFYSSEVFNFDCKKNLEKICQTVINSMNYGDVFNKSYFSLIFRDSFIYHLLLDMLSQDIISLRTLVKMYVRKLKNAGESYELPGGTIIYFDENFKEALQIRAICELLGGRHNFLKAIEKFNSFNTYFPGIELHCKRFIHLLSYDDYGKSSQEIKFEFGWNGTKHSVVKIPRQREAAESIRVFNSEDNDYTFKSGDFVLLFKKAVELLAKLNYLN